MSATPSTVGLTASEVSIELGGRRVVDGVTFDLAPATTLGLVGPNGSGKSTLLRGLLGLQPLASGRVTVAGRAVDSYRPRELARVVAAVLQDETGDFDLDANDVVAMGRGCHRGLFERDTERDRQVVAESLAAVDATHLARRPIASMSGGERQRVLVARALAQESQVLVMDEPTNHLDVRHQFDVLDLAARYCDRLVVLQRGRVVAAGAPAEVLEPSLLGRVYEADAQVGLDPDTGRPHVRFRPSHD